MTSQDLKKYALPDEPGVYFFYQGNQILYIGKATSLKDRVRSYFAGDLGDTRGPRLVKMLELADDLKWQTTGSVLEALLLETELIKKHQPKYNAREKDDKSYNYVIITKELYPRLLVVRGKDITAELKFDIKDKFGPFPSGRDLKIALRLIRKIFPWRDKCLPGQGKPCFERQLGLCPGVCTGEISPRAYAKNIARLRLILVGQFSTLKTKLEADMKAEAKKLHFEQANIIKKQLFALDHLQDVALISSDKEPNSVSFRIEAYDIAHLSGTNTVGGLAVWQNGDLRPSEYRRFKIKGLASGQVDDLKNLAEILTRRLAHVDWPAPDLIVVDGDERIRQVAMKICQAHDLVAPVVAVVKDDKHKAAQLLGDTHIIRDYHKAIVAVNLEVHRYTLSFHRKLRSRMLK